MAMTDIQPITRARLAVALLLASALAGCQTTKVKPVLPSPVTVEQAKASGWLAIASVADRNRIDRVASAWTEGLAAARISHRGDVTEEGLLLKPRAGLARPAPTPGSYSCKLVTLGSDKSKSASFERFKPFFCYVEVEGNLFTIVKQTGSQRPAGRLDEDDVNTRLVFLGTLALGSEEEARAYGDDPRRNMAGIFERIAPFRWRLVIPYPQDGGKIDVFELTPVADQPNP